MECRQPLVRHGHRNQGCNKQTNDEPLAHILEHFHKSIVHAASKLGCECASDGFLRLTTIRTVSLFMTKRRLCRNGFVLLCITIDQPSAEHGREKRGNRSNDGKRKSHQRISRSDGIHACLRGCNKKTGTSSMRSSLPAKSHTCRDYATRTQRKRNA